MGFSVSGSVAIISIGVLVAFGVMFPAVIDSSQQVSEAQSTQSERILDQQNTEIHINDTTYDGENLTVAVVNEGTVSLNVEQTDVIVDGEYHSPNVTTVYRTKNMTQGNTDTRIWLSGEVLELVVAVDSDPRRVKIVTETGVSEATMEVQ